MWSEFRVRLEVRRRLIYTAISVPPVVLAVSLLLPGIVAVIVAAAGVLLLAWEIAAAAARTVHLEETRLAERPGASVLERRVYSALSGLRYSREALLEEIRQIAIDRICANRRIGRRTFNEMLRQAPHSLTENEDILSLLSEDFRDAEYTEDQKGYAERVSRILEAVHSIR